MPKLLDIRTTSRLLGVHPNTLRLWDTNGKLRAVRIGTRRDRRYDRVRVAEFWTEQHATSVERARQATERVTWRVLWRLSPMNLSLISGLFVVALALPFAGWAQSNQEVTFTAPITQCSGWTVGPDGKSTFSSDSQEVQGTTGITVGSLDQTDASLTCRSWQRPKKPKGTLTQAWLQVTMSGRAGSNSTDSLFIEASVDGKSWAVLKHISVAAIPSGVVTMAIPGEDMSQLDKLRIRLRPDIDIAATTTTMSLRSISLQVAVKTAGMAAQQTKQATQREKKLDKLTEFSQSAYHQGEQPVITVPKLEKQKFLFFTVGQQTWTVTSVEAIDTEGSRRQVAYRGSDVSQGNTIDTHLKLDTANFHPGKYRLRITTVDGDGNSTTVEKEFLWGVAALNVTHALARPGITQTVGMGVLDDNGVTICDAEMTLSIKSPSGKTSKYTTADKTISTSSTCVDKGVTNKADYSVEYPVTEEGLYYLTMRAKTKVGDRTVQETFQSDRGLEFDVDRFDYPTRIYPLSPYPVRIAITPTRDYRGYVREHVPSDFVLSKVFPEGSVQARQDGQSGQEITWSVDWQKGQTHFLSYTFDAPDISPALFTTGPLTIGTNFLKGADFTEPRQWQIASDSTTYTGKQARTVEFVLGTGGLTCNTSNNACGSDTNATARTSGQVVYFGNQISTTRTTAAAKSIALQGSGIRVLEAYIDTSVHLVTATSVTDVDSYIDVEGSVNAGSDSRLTPTTAPTLFDQSGHNGDLRWRSDATALFDRQDDSAFNAGLDVKAAYAVTGPTSILGTIKLVITYESDYSTSSHTETKTVRFPLDSTETNANGSKITACTNGQTCGFSFTPLLGDAANGADSDIKDVFFELTGETNTATASTMQPQLSGGTAAQTYPWLDTILNQEGINFIFRPAVGGSDFARSGTQTLNIVNGTESIQGLGGVLVVTYDYNTSAATQTDTVRYYVRQETAANPGASQSVNSPVSVTVSNTGMSMQNIWVKAEAPVSESNTLTLKGDVGGTVDGSGDVTNAVALGGSDSIRAGDADTIYLDLSSQAANFSSATTAIDIERQYSGTSGDAPVGMELFLTFTWSGSSGGTVTKTLSFGDSQGGLSARANSYASKAMTLSLPEQVTKTYRDAYLVTNVSHSDATSLVDSSQETIGVDTTTGGANKTTVVEQPDEGSVNTTEEATLFTFYHDIGSTVFSGGSTIGWRDREFTVSAAINQAEEAWFTHDFVVTYDAAFGDADPQAATANTSTRTVEYVLGTGGLTCSGSNNACGSDNNATARTSAQVVYFGNQISTTRTTASYKSIPIQGSGIRVLEAYLDVSVHLVTGTDVTDLGTYIDVEGSATAGSDSRITPVVAPTLYDSSGPNSDFRWRADATAFFDRQDDTAFNAGLDVKAAYAITGPTTIMGTIKLVVTYKQDYSTSAHTETKTVRFPLDSTETNANGTKITACAASDTTTCDFNYNANLEDSGTTIRDVYFEMTGETNNSLGATFSNQITGGTASPNFVGIDTVAGQENLNWIFAPAISDFAADTAQVLEVNNGAIALQGLGGVLVVTYDYSTGTSTQTDTVRYFVRQETAANQGTSQSANSPVAVTISNTGLSVQNIWVKAEAPVSEANTLTLKGDVGGTVDGSGDVTNPIVLGASNSIRVGATERLYLDLSSQAANFSSATTSIDIEKQYSGASGDAPVGMELYVTFTWSGSSGGTETRTVTYGDTLGGVAARASSFNNKPLYAALPEAVAKTYRSAYLVTNVSHSDATSIVDSSQETIGVDTTTGGANKTTIVEQPDEGTTATEENTLFTFFHDIGSTVFSGGSTIGWSSRTFEVTAAVNQAEEAMFSHEMVITYDAAHGAVTLAQNHFRWRDDTTALNTDGGWTGSQDAIPTLTKSTTYRVRVEVANTGGAPAVRYPMRLEYAAKSGTCGASSFTAVPVTPTSEPFELVASGQYADQDAITASRLTATGTFTNGLAVEDPGTNANAITVTNGYYTEVEYAVQATTNATDGGSYCFRVTNLGSTTNFSYTTYTEATIATSGITVAGTIYQSSNEASGYGCNGNNLTMYVAVNGDTTPDTGLCNSVDGTFSISGVTDPGGADVPIAVYIDSGESVAATTVTLSSAASADIAGLTLIIDRVVLTQQNSTAMSNSLLATADNGNAGIRYSVSGGNLTTESGMELHVLTGKTFTPGGNVTTTASSSSGSIAGDLHIESTATVNMSTNGLSVGGHIVNSGTLNLSSGQTTTLTATGSGFSIPASSTFQNLVLNGSGGGFTNAGALTVSGTFNLTNGSFTHTANTTVTVNGSSFTLANGTTWNKTSGTGKLVLENATNLAFADNNTTKQDLGAVQAGASPGVTTLTTDMSATSLTIPNTDTFNSKGYDVTLSDFLDCQGACVLDLTDTAPNNEGDGTILDVGGNFTMSTSATFTAYTNSKLFMNSTAGADTTRAWTTGDKTYNDVEIKNAGPTSGVVEPIGNIDVNGNLTLTDGVLDGSANPVVDVNIAGNLSIASGAGYGVGGTVTFDGSGTSTWTDANGSGGVDMGAVVINGSTKTVNLASDAKATTLSIAASQTFGLGSSGYTFTLTGSGTGVSEPFQNSGTLNEGTNSTFKFAGTSNTDIEPEGYWNLTFAPPSGTATYYNDPSETSNPVTVGGALVVGDGTHTVTLNMGTFSVWTVSGDVTINASGTLQTNTDANDYFGGSFTNNGTYTDAGNVVFNATTTGKTISGTLTGSSAATLIFDGVGGGWTIASNIDCTGLSIIHGSVTQGANITMNVSGNWNMSNGTTFTKASGTGTITFNGTIATTYTDNNTTKQNIGDVTITKTNGTPSNNKLTLGSSMTVDTMVISASNTLDLANSGYVLTVADAGASANILTVTGTLTTNSNSTVDLTGSNSGGTVNIPAVTYVNLGVGTTADSTAETYDATGSFAVSGVLTVGNASSGATDTLDGKTYTITLSGTGTPFVVDSSHGAFTGSTSTVNYTGATSTITVAGLTYYNVGVGTTADANGVTYQLGGDTTASGVFTVGNASSSATDTLDASTYTLTLSGSGTPFVVDTSHATFTRSTSTVVYSGTSATTISAQQYYSLTLGLNDANSVTYTLNTAAPTNGCSFGSSGTYTQACGGTLTIATGDTFTVTGVNLTVSQSATLALNGTLNGTGTLTYFSSTEFPTTGTISIATIWVNIYFGDLTLSPRTYTSQLIPVQFNTTSNTIYLGAVAESGSMTLAGSNGMTFYAQSTGNVTLDNTRNNWNVTTGSDITFAGSGAGTEYILAGNGTWAIAGSVNFTNGVFTAGNSTLSMSGTSKTLTSAGNSLYNFTQNGGSATMSGTTTVSHDLTISSGTTTAPSSGSLTVGNTFTNNGTFTHNSSTVTMSGSSGTITGSSTTAFSGLTISGTTVTLAAGGSDISVAGALTISASDTLSLGSGRTLTDSGTSDVSWGDSSSTISGSGRLTFTSTSTGGPGTGGVVSSIVRYDATSGDIPAAVADARTYGGDVEVYSNGAARAVTPSGTYTIGGNFKVITGASASTSFTFAGATSNPTMNITGSLSYTKGGSMTPAITTGNGTWTISGNADFSNGNITAATLNTFVMNGNSTTLTGNNKTLYNLTINANPVTLQSSTLLVSHTLTVSVSERLTISGTQLSLTGLSGTSLNLAGTIDGTGTLAYGNSLTAFPTSGTISAKVQFYGSTDTVQFGNRTFGGDVECYDAVGFSCQIIAGTTTINGSLYITDNGDGITFDADTYDPTVYIGQNFYGTFGGGGVFATMGDNPWTVSGNFDLSSFASLTQGSGVSATLVMDGAAGSGTFTPGAFTMNNVTLTPGSSKTVTLSNTVTLTMQGNLTLGGSGTLTTTGTTIDMTGTSKTIDGGGKTVNNLTIDGTITAQTNDLTVGGTLAIGNSKTLTITTITVTNTGSSDVSWGTGSTITGSGKLTFTDTSGGPGSSGTLSVRVVFDASTNNIGSSTFDARTYGAKVFLWANNSSARSITAAAGGYTFSGDVDVTAAGAGTMTANLSAATGTTTMTGILTISANGILSAPAILSLGSNFTNSGTFTHNNGLVQFTTNNNSTIDGSTTFYDLTFTNTVAKTMTFVHGTTTTVTHVWTVTGTSGQLITLTRDNTSNWTINPTSASVDYADVNYSTNSGTSICATHSQSTNDNNSGWSISAGASCGVTLSGTVYQSSSEGSQYDCTSGSGGQLDLDVAVNGDVTPDTGSCTSGIGSFSLTVTDPGAADIPIAIYVANTESEKATTVTLSASGGSNITGISLFLDRVTVSQQSGTAMTNSYLTTADNGDTGIRYNVSAGALTVDSGMELHVLAGKSFTPGGSVTTTSTATSSGAAGDLHIPATATMTMGTNDLSVGGDFTNAGTLSVSSGQTTTLTATGSGFGFASNGMTFYSLTFSGSSGSWTSTDNTTVATTFTVGANATVAIASGKTIYTTANSGTPFALTGTLNGPGTIDYQKVDNTTPGTPSFPTSGTLNANVNFNPINEIVNTRMYIPARTYGGNVSCADEGGISNICRLGSGTITISGNFSLDDIGDGAQVEGNSNNPTVTIAGNVSATGSFNTLIMGSGTWTVSGSFDLTNISTFTHSSGTLVMNGTGTLTTSGQTLYNFTTSGSGTITLASATHTLAGSLVLGSSATLTPGTSTVVMSGSSKTIDGGGKTLNNLTISGSTTTLQNSNLTVAGTLTVSASQTLSINSGITLTDSGSSEVSWGNGSSTVSGSGTLIFPTGAGGPGTSGVLSSLVRYDSSSGNMASTTIDARTYNNQVEFYSNSSSTRTVTLTTGTYTASGSSAHWYLNAAGSGDLIMAGDTNNPTVTIGGNLDFTGSGSGIEVLAAGTGTWTVSGNVDFTDGVYGPSVASLAPTSADTAERQDSILNGTGCSLSTAYSCLGSGTVQYGYTSTGDCLGFGTDQYLTTDRGWMEYNPTSISDTATIMTTQLGVNVTGTYPVAVNVTRSTTDDLASQNCTISSGTYAKISGSTYGTSSLTSTGGKLISLGSTGVSDIQSRITGSTARLSIGLNSSTQESSMGSIAALVSNYPALYVGYADGGSPTLVMNGSSKTLTTAGNALYNLTLSGTITLSNETDNIWGNLSMTGGTVTAGSSTVVMNGSGKTITGGNNTLSALTINGNTTVQTANLSTSGQLTVANSTTLTITGVILSNTYATDVALNGTITGSGTLRFTSTSGGPGTSGTLSSVVQFDASSGNIASTTVDARTYGGSVEFYKLVVAARTITLASGTYSFGNVIIDGNQDTGAGNLAVAGNTGNPTVNVTGFVTGQNYGGSEDNTLSMGSGTWTIGGNFDLTDITTFNHNSGTVVLNGSSQQTLTGASRTFNNLTITNTSGSDPDSSPSVIFVGGLSTAGTLTAITPNTKLRFATGVTYAPTTINFAGSSGNLVYLRSATPGTAVTFNAGAGARTVTYTSIKDSNACGSSGGVIDASGGTNEDRGNTPCWLINKLTVTLSANTLNLGTLSSTQVNQGYITSTVTTNAPLGYISLVKYDHTLTAGSTTIADTSGGTIGNGDNEYGASTDESNSVNLTTSSNSCASGSGPMNATALSTTFQSFAASATTASGRATKLCLSASAPGTQAPGTYQSTLTVVTTAKF